jgi:hypothetical protein
MAFAQMRVPAHSPCQREAGLFASDGPAAIPLPPIHPGAKVEKTLVVAAEKAKPNRKAEPVKLANTATSAKPLRTKSVRVAEARGGK